jgi:hypothetical protein
MRTSRVLGFASSAFFRFVSFVAPSSESKRAALRSVNGLEAEREAFGRPFWRN